MVNDRVFKLIEKFVALATEPHINEQYQAQRDMLSEFHEQFYGGIRSIISELGGDVLVLRGRKFEPSILKMLTKVHNDLVAITREINPDKPYIAAEKLVAYVLDKPNSHIIENLNFLTKHHVKTTNVDVKSTPSFSNPKMQSLDKLKVLAHHLKQFMSQHTLLADPNPISISPHIKENLEEVPAFFAGKEDKTKA
jgi:hypothetical protein